MLTLESGLEAELLGGPVAESSCKYLHVVSSCSRRLRVSHITLHVRIRVRGRRRGRRRRPRGRPLITDPATPARAGREEWEGSLQAPSGPKFHASAIWPQVLCTCHSRAVAHAMSAVTPSLTPCPYPWSEMFPRGCQVRHHDHDDENIWIVEEAGQDTLPRSTENAYCYHGTSLSAALLISTKGFKVGPSTDAGRTGIFCIGPASHDVVLPLATLFMHAKDRAKPHLCTEWTTFGTPSCWSMPVVIAFQAPKKVLCGCGKVGEARKWVMKGVPGQVFDFGPIHILFELAEYHAWYRLHKLCELPANQNCLKAGALFSPSHERMVMCGGKTTDSFFWCRESAGCFASCGRVCAVSEMNSAPNGTVSTTGVWRCVKCYTKHFG